MHISRHVKQKVTSEKSRAQHIEEAQQRYEEFSALRPPFLVAVREDAKVFCANRGEPYEFKTRWGEFFNILRLLWAADDFLGLTIYRLRSSLHAAKVPILPRLLEFVHTKLDLYKKLNQPSVNKNLKDMWYSEYRRGVQE